MPQSPGRVSEASAVPPQARQQAQLRQQMAEDSKAEYSSMLQRFNGEQHEHYYTHIPTIFQVRAGWAEGRLGMLGTLG